MQGRIIDVEPDELRPADSLSMEPTLSYELNKYAWDIIKQFNEHHKMNLRCTFGLTRSKETTSSLKDNCIDISLGIGAIDDEKDKNMKSALKILVGAEVSKYLFNDMQMDNWDVFVSKVGPRAYKCRHKVMQCTITTAADLFGLLFFELMNNEITEEVYEEYQRLISVDNKMELANAKKKRYAEGKLPAKFRVELMRKYKGKRFRENDYEIMHEIIREVSRVALKYNSERLGLHEFENWIIDLVKISGFPYEINKKLIEN